MGFSLVHTISAKVLLDRETLLRFGDLSDEALAKGYQETEDQAIWLVMEWRYGKWRIGRTLSFARRCRVPPDEWPDVIQETSVAIPNAMLTLEVDESCRDGDFARLLPKAVRSKFVDYLRQYHRTHIALTYGLLTELLEDELEPIKEMVAIEAIQQWDAAVARLPEKENYLYHWLAAGNTQAAFALEIHVSPTSVNVVKRKMFAHLRREFNNN